MNATATAPVAAVETAGDVAIREAALPGATVKTLLKAVWSTRGFLRVPYGPVEAFGGLGVIKADLTGMLKNLPEGDPAPYLLTPVAGGAMLTVVTATAAE